MVQYAIVAALLFAGVAVVLLSCAGLLVGDEFDRMHFLGPATVLAPWLFALAVVARAASKESMIKSALLALAILLSSPILTHATARAAYLNRESREHARAGRRRKRRKKKRT